MSWDIRVGRGVGPIDIGMTPEQVVAVLGTPADETVESESEEDEQLLWSYPDLALTFVLDREGHRLDYLHVEKAETSLDGVRVIGLGHDEILGLAARAGLGQPTSVIPNQGGLGFGKARYSHGGDSAIYFWLHDGRVTSVQLQDAKS